MYRTDPDREYSYYDLTKDADHVLTGTSRRAKHSFSRMKHFPPEDDNGRIPEIKRKKRRLEQLAIRSKSIFNSQLPGGHMSMLQKMDWMESKNLNNSNRMPNYLLNQKQE